MNTTDLITGLVVGLTALATAIGGIIKQIYDHSQTKKWLCTRDPCAQRIPGVPPPDTPLQ